MPIHPCAPINESTEAPLVEEGVAEAAATFPLAAARLDDLPAEEEEDEGDEVAGDEETR